MELHDESPDDLALLENAAWVKRLARSLIANAHLAEDGAQDALAAARALVGVDGLDAEAIVRRSMAIAAEICIYTNETIHVVTLP